METKICKSCNREFPKTKEYFQFFKNRNCLKLSCKKCDLEKKKYYRYVKKSKEFNVTVEEYINNIIYYKKEAQIIKNQKLCKYDINKDRTLTSSQKDRNSRILRSGYSLDSYDKEWKIKLSKKFRKYNYSDNVEKIEPKETAKKSREIASKCFIASLLKISVKDLPEDLYNAKRQNLFLKRKLKNNEKSIKICN